ncbi:endodeoxyribonuclease [Telmatospirillum sp. J64-1]|uniref:endodeoxyribonuclease n=1 Tax=Telmatospirillum sp. J64-1 TaxID=2502183 RepID=UPI00115D1869|nr:endodeoxyribonuclease [Telmatospirillum sp. J64-1]
MTATRTKPRKPKTATTTSDPGLKNGYRSGLEEEIAAELEARGVPVRYEVPDTVIPYTKPARMSRYTPDFVLPNGIIIETKGRFVTADRQKHLLIKQQHPDLDIRFVFSNSRQRISKQSKTTYADWCLKHGFLFADRTIPEEWINEPPRR